jgi:excisionase family DNA binding protein
MEKYLTIDEAADVLGMSPRYVRRLISERRIAFYRLGRSVRLAETDLQEFARSGRVEPITRASVWAGMRGAA